MTGNSPFFTRHGSILVVSGPSGAGKSTVCRRLLAAEPEVHFSVSCTTREPRAGERHGREYYFLALAEFQRRAAAGDFLEHAEVHGHLYGTLREEVERFVLQGQDVLLDIDVQGARQVRERVTASRLSQCLVSVFFAPPSFADLEQRLRGRGTDSEATIQCRLTNAARELEAWREYDYMVINDTVAEAATRLAAILASARCATRRIATVAPGFYAPVASAAGARAQA